VKRLVVPQVAVLLCGKVEGGRKRIGGAVTKG